MDHVPVDANGLASTRRGAEGPASGQGHQGKPKKVGNNKLPLIAAAVAVVLLLMLAVGGWLMYQSSTNAHIENGKYQAVFFTNGQVYFGKLQKLNGNYFKLTNVFYLEAKDNADTENPQDAAAQDSPDVQLIKLGNEIHGPEDAMIISKEQILFFENLKQEGKVSSTITKYESDKNKQNQTNQGGQNN